MERVKVALIGYGHLGKWHAQKAQALETSEFVAIVEPTSDEQARAKEAYPGLKVVSTVEEIITDIDAALIVTPTSFHFEYLQTLLKNDKHIFCEKPLCQTIAEVKELEPLLKDKVYQVGHSERCHLVWDEIVPRIGDDKSRKTIRINRFAPFKGRATDVDVVSDLMIHDIDLLLYLLKSRPVKISATGHKIRTDNWDHVTAHFILENGDEAIIVSGRNHAYEERSFE